MRAVSNGNVYLSPKIPNLDIEELQREIATGDWDSYQTLSNREREVFQLVAEGLSSPAIGKKLFISTRTVETHRANISRKLGLGNATEFVRFAIARRLIEVEPQPRDETQGRDDEEKPESA